VVAPSGNLRQNASKDCKVQDQKGLYFQTKGKETNGNKKKGTLRKLLAENKKHNVTKLLGQIPAIDSIRAGLLIDLIQTPDRLRTK
jgi:hypothetical protein